MAPADVATPVFRGYRRGVRGKVLNFRQRLGEGLGRRGGCEYGLMITEHALLPVIAGREAEFERAFERARPIIASMPGFVSLSLSRSVETPTSYLLLVEWQTLEHHTVGFRESPQYAEWKALLHHFYEPFPVVEHFVEVPEGSNK